MSNSPKILIADDHSMVRKGLRFTLTSELGYSDISEAKSCKELMAKLKRDKFSHLLLDINLSDGSSLELLPTIKSLYPDLLIAVISVHPTAVFARVIERDPKDYYITKSTSENDVSRLLSEFLQNIKQRRSPSRAVENPFAGLSRDQFTIMNYLVSGCKQIEICRLLNIKANTLSTQKGRIFDKLGIKTLKELSDLARVYKIIE